MKRAIGTLMTILLMVSVASPEKKPCSEIHYPHSKHGCIPDAPKTDADILASGVQRSVARLPALRDAMKDPDSFVLESVHIKSPHKDAVPDICYAYRSRNSFGGYDRGTARLNSKDNLDAFYSSSEADEYGIHEAMNPCSARVRSEALDITAAVKAALLPAPATTSPADRAKQAQAYADCLKLAVDNPKIVCKQ